MLVGILKVSMHCFVIYDVIISYSSLEHSGLGRYGDYLNPNGDLETMDEIYNHLTKKVPSGAIYIIYIYIYIYI